MPHFSAEEFERLRSWLLEITAHKLPHVKTRDEGVNRRWIGQGGLVIHRRTGAWCHHSTRAGGHSPIALIMYIDHCDAATAVEWASAWLASHPGTGECTAAGNDDDGAPASRADAEQVLREMVDPAGTPAQTFLCERRIDLPHPADIHYWPNARIGEGAIVYLLRAHGRVAGVQVGYLDPYGNKSVVLPQRRRFMLEKAPGAVFEIPSPGNGPVETIIACGIEDAITVHRYGRRGDAERQWRVVGLPGDGALRHVRVDKGSRVTVCRDADADNPAADRALAEGLDHLLLQAGFVPEWSSTGTPGPSTIYATRTVNHGKDANAVLIEKGVDGLTALLDDIEPAGLSSPRGIIRWLATLDRLDCDAELKQARKVTGVRSAVLRAEIAELRKRSNDHDPGEPEDPGLLDEDIDLASVLDAILVEMQRYIVSSETLLGTAAVWAAFTHLVHSENVRVPVAPRLGIQAKTSGCGKTILLEILHWIVFNPRPSASITVSTVLRTVALVKPTMLLDDVHRLFRAHEKSELISLLNAGHYRWNAYVERSAQRPNGEWTVERFGLWATMALAGIGEMPQEQQERAIIINLRRALAKDVPARLRDGASPTLVRLQQQLATWAATVEELPEPVIPSAMLRLPGRVVDNWRPIFAIADMAGGRWPPLVRKAAAEAAHIEHAPNFIERLLSGIKTAFDRATALDKKAVDRLATGRLLALMLDDQEEEWSTENRGRSINRYWLRDRLRGLIDPPGSQEWWEPEGEPRVRQTHEYGYLKSQFKRSWDTYLAGEVHAEDSDEDDGTVNHDTHPHARSPTSPTSGPSPTNGENSGGNAEDPVVGHGDGRSGIADKEAPFVGDGDAWAGTTDKNGGQKPQEIRQGVGDGGDVGDVGDAARGGHTHVEGSSAASTEMHSERDKVSQPKRKRKVALNDPSRPRNRAANGEATTGALDALLSEPPSVDSEPLTPPWRSRTDQVREILQEHPGWDYKKVAEHMGQPAGIIGTIFKSMGLGL